MVTGLRQEEYRRCGAEFKSEEGITVKGSPEAESLAL